MKVIVGIGNPGTKYAGTRHNVGFEVIDYLAAAPTCGPFRSKFQALVAETKEGDEQVLLVKPETFMNLSGRCVRQIVDFYKLTVPTDLLIVSDDFNLPLGKLRARAKGSHGGQDGLGDIREGLGTDEFPRLRIGVGQPEQGDAVDYVLSRFKPAERKVVEDSIALAAKGVLVFVKSGIEACMNAANGGEGQGARGKGQEKKKDEKEKKKDEGDKPTA